MKGIDNITDRIEALREKLSRLIIIKEDLLDPEVVIASQKLDKALDEYNSIIFGGFK